MFCFITRSKFRKCDIFIHFVTANALLRMSLSFHFSLLLSALSTLEVQHLRWPEQIYFALL